MRRVSSIVGLCCSLVFADRPPVGESRAGDRNQPATGLVRPRRLTVDAGLFDFSKGISTADLRMLFGVDLRTGALTSLDAKTGDRKVLVRGEQINGVGPVSPDGRRLVYNACTLTGNACDWELRTVALDGTAKHTVIAFGGNVQWVEPYSWTPDAQHIVGIVVGQRRRRQIALISTLDGAISVLKDLDWRAPSNLALSPDGRRVAYEFDADRGLTDRDVYILELATRTERPITRDRTPKSVLGWTQDGSGVLYTTKSNAGTSTVWHVGVHDGEAARVPRAVVRDIRGFGVASVVRGVVLYSIADERRGVYAVGVDLDAGRIMKPPTPVVARVEMAFSAFLSPDATRLAWSRQLHAPGPNRSAIVVLDRRSGKQSVIPLALADVVLEQWEADGRALILTGKALEEVARYRFEFSAPRGEAITDRRLTPLEGVARVTLSPDSSTAYVVRGDSATGINRVVAQRRGIDTERVIHEAPALRAPLFVSPNGKFLTVTRGIPRGRLEIQPGFDVVTTGGPARRLYSSDTTLFVGVNSITWTRDSRHLLFRVVAQDSRGNSENQLWSVTPTTGAAHWLLSEKRDAFRERSIQVGLNGREVIYTVGPESRPRELWILENLPGSNAERRVRRN